MSVDQLPTRPPKAGGTKLVQYDEYIDRQVESTRRVVKLVDLATSLVVLATGVLAYFLVLAMAEHWLVPGGFNFAARVALFALLAGGVAYFAVRRLWPLVIGRINPVYAAQAIEQTGPSLKNSLVNLLLFRQKRADISDAVYKTLEEQAAQRLSRVPIDAAVDRTLLIRFGYVLVAIVALASLYKVFSPKDPIVSAKRVLMPWADIVPASRVTIAAIEPGAITLARGENLDVSAEVRGIGDSDSVVLKYTTRDGRAVDKPVLMRLAGDGMRYEGRLPDSASGGDAGLAESLTYRIEAGDARSLDYAVNVVATPSILVERIDYDYPQYTGYVDRSVEGLGDIRAIEGTRVTIHARANGAIVEAHVDFDADGRRELPMKVSDVRADSSFVLELRDRETLAPKHASYVLRFMNKDRRPNVRPVKHSINVEPDYAPEASIVSPREDVLNVRLDETVTIEVEARDPDFGLSGVQLHGEAAGRAVLEQQMLKGNEKRLASRFQLTPSAHGLKAGDRLEYWVTASDNRTPTANTTPTNKKVLMIVSPEPNQQPPPDRLAQRDQRQQPGEGQQGQSEKQPQDGNAGGEQGESQQGGDAAQGHKETGKQGEQDNQGGQQSSSGQSSESDEPFSRDAQQSGEAGQGDKETGSQGDTESADGNQDQQQDGDAQHDSQSGQQSGSDQQGGNKSGQQQGDQQGQKQGGKSDTSEKQTGAGTAGGEPSNGSQSAGTRPDGNTNGSQSQGKQSDNGQQPPADAKSNPVSSEGDDDAEAFNRIQKHMEGDGELKEGENDSQQSGDEQHGQGGKETGRQGDSSDTARDGEQATDSRDAQRSAEQQQGNNDAGQQADAQKSEGAEQQKSDAENQTGTKPGSESQSEPTQSEQQGKEGAEQQRDQGGEQTAQKGEAGAGEEQETQGAPESSPSTKPGEKREQQGSSESDSNKQEPPVGGRGKKESDSQGEEGGDRAGGGEEGGGQKSPRDGTGSAGQNQSADEGAGESGEQGQGNDSTEAGQEKVADRKTGQSGETSGRGSKTKLDESDDPSDERGPQAGGEGAKDEQPKSEQQKRNDQEDAGRPQPSNRDGAPQSKPGEQRGDGARDRGAPTGDGGEAGSDAPPPLREEGDAPPGDDPNLEYARQKTDLVLEKLSDQLKKKKVNKDLLKQLGWSEAELTKFVERRQSRKEAAAKTDEGGEVAKRELDEALRSLGLRRGAMQQNQVRDDDLRDLKEGYRGAVPLEYQERLRAYNEGVSRAEEDE